MCLCFGLAPAPKVFTKLLKIPIALLRRINIRIIVYLDDILLMGRTLQEIMTARDILIFLLQNLGFVINLKKSILQPVKQLEFLGLQINTEEMTLSLSEEKLTHIIQQCQEVYSQPRTSVLSLTKLIGLLSSRVQTIFPGKIQFGFLQQEQIPRLKKQGSYVILGNLARHELLWWIENDRKIQQQEPQLTIQTDASTKGWGAHCNGISTGVNGRKKNSDTT